jgi:hypothetical protein
MGQANVSLGDAMILRGATRAHVEFDMIHAEAMLDTTLLMLRMILGSDHPLAMGTESFMA